MNKIFSKDYEIGDFWSRADLKLSIGEPFQVVIEGVIGDGYAGDIAIDDTSFTPGCVPGNVELVTVTTPQTIPTTPNPCAAVGQFMCLENNQCINRSKVCDFNVDCPMPGGSDEANCGTCTFDANNGTFCGWKDHSNGDLEWTLRQGPTSLGPSGDHTTGNGFYIAIPEDDFYGYASIRTPSLGPSSVECQLRFWYYMDYDEDNDDSRISIYFRYGDDDSSTFEYIEDVADSTGPQWKQASVNIGAQTTRFAIGKSYQTSGERRTLSQPNRLCSS